MDSRAAAKAAAAFALDVSGVRRLVAGLRRTAAGGRRVLVFGYHRVCESFETERVRGIESCLISRATFRAHVEYLAGRFDLVDMTGALRVLTGEAGPGRDVAVITFDDGYHDVLQNALPVLREFRAPAVVYVSTGVVERAGRFPHDRLHALLLRWSADALLRERTPGFSARAIDAARRQAGEVPRLWLGSLIQQKTPAELERLVDELAAAARVDPDALVPESARPLQWDGVRELAAAGVEIGAHTVRHVVLTHLGREEVESELLASRRSVEDRIGRPVRHFAYCNGYYNDVVIAALRRCGYASGVTTEDRLNRLGQDPFRIARRVLWERSAQGPRGKQSPHLLACQLDDTWSALRPGGDSGHRPERLELEPAARRRLA